MLSSNNVTYKKELSMDIRRKRYLAKFSCTVEEIEDSIKKSGLTEDLESYFIDTEDKLVYFVLLPGKHSQGQKPKFFTTFDNLLLSELAAWDYRKDVSEFKLKNPHYLSRRCNFRIPKKRNDGGGTKKKEHSVILDNKEETKVTMTANDMFQCLRQGKSVKELFQEIMNSPKLALMPNFEVFNNVKNLLYDFEKEILNSSTEVFKALESEEEEDEIANNQKLQNNNNGHSKKDWNPSTNMKSSSQKSSTNSKEISELDNLKKKVKI